MIQIKFKHAMAAGLLVSSAVGASTAAECFKQVRPFPTFQQFGDSTSGSCGTGNRADGNAFWSNGDDPSGKAVAGTKKTGTQDTFVNGVTSSNAPIQGCGVMVNNPNSTAAGHSKVDQTGCLNAVKWQLRMFD